VDAPAPFKYLDHTCVVVSCPGGGIDIFQCGGHDKDTAGLTPVAGAGGNGDYTVAKDHRAPPADLAGIDYLKTGVCHQAANRFLSCVPGKPKLNNTVNGYTLSKLLFGEYGKKWTPWMTDKELVHGLLSDVAVLGIEADTVRVRAVHEKMLAEKARLDASNLSAEEHARRFDEITDDFQRELMSCMSPDDYERLMGSRPGEMVRLTDPERNGPGAHRRATGS
jgi:hypothetical protein